MKIYHYPKVGFPEVRVRRDGNTIHVLAIGTDTFLKIFCGDAYYFWRYDSTCASDNRGAILNDLKLPRFNRGCSIGCFKDMAATYDAIIAEGITEFGEFNKEELP